MGGIGSGTWERWDKKSTVEESLTLEMRDFRGRIHPHSSGTFTWVWYGGHESQVRYVVTCLSPPTITLQYRWADGEDIRIPIRLESTPTNFDGERWWFVCPLMAGEQACRRRAGKLYLPPGARYFGCRRCHRLTYESCREAHQSKRLLERWGTDSRIEALRRQLRAICGGKSRVK